MVDLKNFAHLIWAVRWPVTNEWVVGKFAFQTNLFIPFLNKLILSREFSEYLAEYLSCLPQSLSIPPLWIQVKMRIMVLKMKSQNTYIHKSSCLRTVCSKAFIASEKLSIEFTVLWIRSCLSKFENQAHWQTRQRHVLIVTLQRQNVHEPNFLEASFKSHPHSGLISKHSCHSSRHSLFLWTI